MITFGKSPRVKTLKRDVFPQAPSPTMTSLLNADIWLVQSIAEHKTEIQQASHECKIKQIGEVSIYTKISDTYRRTTSLVVMACFAKNIVIFSHLE